MSTAVTTFNPGKLPDYLKNIEPSAVTKALAGSGGAGFPRRLSIKGGVFRFIVSGKEVSTIDERFLDIVIVNSQPTVGRQWYAKQFSEDSNQGPACWSSNGDVPDPDVGSTRQHTNCRDCPKNVKGSGTGDSKACRYSKRLAVVLANDLEGEILQLSLPAKSIFGEAVKDQMPLQTYAQWLLAHNPPINADTVVTQIRFDTAEESPKLYFKTIRYLEQHEHDIVKGHAASQDAHDAILMTVAPAYKLDEPALAAPAAAPQIASPARKAGGDSTPDESAVAAAPATKKRGRPAKAKTNGEATLETPEPVVRAKPEPMQVPPSPGLSSVVAAWDTDDE
jgi:hypothetical protein